MKKPIEYKPLPPECINFKGVEFWLDQRIQLTPLGKEIRYSGIRLNEDMPYLYGRRHWIYTFIYLDGSGLLEFECDYDNNIKRYVRKCDTE
jgi:hypothetical protein